LDFQVAKSLEHLVLMIMAVLPNQACWAQQIIGQIRPEKQIYLVGEPVFVVLDLANAGPRPIWISESCAWLDTQFEATTAPKPHHEVSLFGCWTGGTMGSCGGSAKQILPGEHYERRYLLDGSFRLDSPGVYPIRARHKIDIYAGETDYRVIASQDLVSEFQLNIAEHDDKELASAYAPVLRDLDSQDGFTSSLAIEAVVQHPPRFLEEVILSLADHPKTAAASVTGLERLATPRAKAKLSELSAPGNPEAIRQSAISALATLGDSAYCSSMLSIGQESSQYSRWLALRAAGYLCGEKALPLLKSLLSSADTVSRFEVAYALGNSHSREAVPSLISLLLDANSNVRRASVDSLTNLTHRSSTSGIDQQEAAGTAHDDWIRWWASEGATAKIYRIDDCSERMPLQ
jgi:HEAT repeats